MAWARDLDGRLWNLNHAVCIVQEARYPGQNAASWASNTYQQTEDAKNLGLPKIYHVWIKFNEGSPGAGDPFLPLFYRGLSESAAMSCVDTILRETRSGLVESQPITLSFGD